MKKYIHLLPISLIALPIIPTISSCSCAIASIYVAIPQDYLKIEDDKLVGFKDPEVDLTGYDTLQVPSNVVSVSGFIYKKGDKSFNAIKNIVGDNSGKWTTIEISAFSSLPELTNIVLPKTITNIANYAFVSLYKLKTIDLSNISDISIIKSDQFSFEDISKAITNGTIIVANNDHKNTLTTTFKDNKWLKGWSIEVKK